MLRFTIGKTRCTLTFGFAAVVCAAFIFGNAQQAAVMLGCILWHECGHILALCRLRTPPRALRMTVFGLELAAGPQNSHKAEALVSLAGPLANVLAACGLFFTPFKTAACFHLLLGLFHLLPIFPLDGGQALQNLLCLHVPHAAVQKITAAITFVFLLPLGTAGFWLLFHRQPNVSLCLLCLYLLFYVVFKVKEE